MKFFHQVLGTFLTEVVILVLNFIAGVLVARVLPPGERGILALIMLAPITLAYFADVGISQAIVYLIARKGHDLRRVLGNALLIGLTLGALIGLLVWAARTPLLRTVFEGMPVGYLVMTLALLPVLMMDNYLLSVLRARQQFGLFNLRRLVTPLLLLIGVIALAGFGRLGLLGAALAFVASQLISFFLSLILVARQTRISLQFSAPLVREAFQFGVKSYAQNLVGHLHYRLDVYLLALFLPPEQVAYYTVATSVAEVAFYIPDSVGTVLFPKLSAESETRVHQITAEASRHTLMVAGVAGIGVLFAGTLLIPLFYGPAYQAAVPPFVALIPGILAMSVYKVLTRNFTSRNRQQITILAAGLALALNAGLNLALIPLWGAVGASVASLLSYTGAAAVLLWEFHRETGIPLASVLLFRREDAQRYRQVLEDFQARWAARKRVGGQSEGTLPRS